MNYEALKELLGMLQNYDYPIDKMEINYSYADIYFESENKTHYEYFMDLWNCDMNNANNSYIRFYLS